MQYVNPNPDDDEKPFAVRIREFLEGGQRFSDAAALPDSGTTRLVGGAAAGEAGDGGDDDDELAEQLEAINPLSVVGPEDLAAPPRLERLGAAGTAGTAAEADSASAMSKRPRPSPARLRGWDDVDERRRLQLRLRRFKARNRMLADIFIQYADQPAKHLHWLLKTVRKLYADKALADAQSDRAGTPHVSLPDFIYKSLKSKYGTTALVGRNIGALVVTAQRYRRRCLEVDIFARFLEEAWGSAVLDRFLTARRLCFELNVGVAYPVARGKVGIDQWVCLIRCEYVAQMILGLRALEAAAPFWRRVYERAVVATDEDLAGLRAAAAAASGAQTGKSAGGAGAAGAEQYDASRTYRKVLVDEFLYMLCEEFILLERDFCALVPERFAAFTGAQGTVPHERFAELLATFGVQPNASDVAQHWLTALAHSDTAATALVDAKGFRELCDAVPAFRERFYYSHVPAYRNVRSELVSKRTQSHMIRVVTKHWRFFRVLFEDYCALLKDHSRAHDALNMLLDLREMLVKILDAGNEGTRAATLYRKVLFISLTTLAERYQAETTHIGEAEAMDRHLDFVENVILDLVKHTPAIASLASSPSRKLLQAGDENSAVRSRSPANVALGGAEAAGAAAEREPVSAGLSILDVSDTNASFADSSA